MMPQCRENKDQTDKTRFFFFNFSHCNRVRIHTLDNGFREVVVCTWPLLVYLSDGEWPPDEAGSSHRSQS